MFVLLHLHISSPRSLLVAYHADKIRNRPKRQSELYIPGKQKHIEHLSIKSKSIYIRQTEVLINTSWTMLASMSGHFISDKPKSVIKPHSPEANSDDENSESSDGETAQENVGSEEDFLEILTQGQQEDLKKFKQYLLEAHDIDKKYALYVHGATRDRDIHKIWKTIDSFETNTERMIQEKTMMKDIQHMLLKKTESQLKSNSTRKLINVFQNYKETFQRLQEKRYGMISPFVLQTEIDIYSECKTLIERFVSKPNSRINWYKAFQMIDERTYGNDIQSITVSLRRNPTTMLAFAKAVGAALLEKSIDNREMNIASMRLIRKNKMDSIFFFINELTKESTKIHVDTIGQPVAPVDIFKIEKDEHGNFVLSTIGKDKILNYKIFKDELEERKVSDVQKVDEKKRTISVVCHLSLSLHSLTLSPQDNGNPVKKKKKIINLITAAAATDN